MEKSLRYGARRSEFNMLDAIGRFASDEALKPRIVTPGAPKDTAADDD